MKRLIAVLAVAALAAALLPSVAAGHTLSKTRARNASMQLAQAVFLDIEEATDYGVDSCKRRSAHRVDCQTYIDYVDVLGEGFCVWTTRVSFRSRTSNKLRVSPTEPVCDYYDLRRRGPAPKGGGRTGEKIGAALR